MLSNQVLDPLKSKTINGLIKKSADHIIMSQNNNHQHQSFELASDILKQQQLTNDIFFYNLEDLKEKSKRKHNSSFRDRCLLKLNYRKKALSTLIFASMTLIIILAIKRVSSSTTNFDTTNTATTNNKPIDSVSMIPSINSNDIKHSISTSNNNDRRKHYQQQRSSSIENSIHYGSDENDNDQAIASKNGLFKQYDSFIKQPNDIDVDVDADADADANVDPGDDEQMKMKKKKKRNEKNEVRRLKRESSNENSSSNNNDKDNLKQSLSSSSSDQMLSSTKAASTTHSSSRIDAENEERSCGQIVSLWVYLRSMYPTLSKHLFEWSQIGRATDERPYLAKSLPVARAVGHLLDEAERVLQNDLIGYEAGKHLVGVLSSPSKQQPMSHSSSAWLARVYQQNPAYARLIQRFRSGNSLPAAADNGDANAAIASTNSGNNNGRLSSSSPLSATTSADGHVYGRVVHYPHELIGSGLNPSSSTLNSAQRTIEKLRLLNKQADSAETSGIGASGSKTSNTGVNELDSELESNRIASSTVSMTAHQLQSYVPDPPDLLRDRFVYGNVVLRQKTDSDLDNIDPTRDNGNLDGNDNSRIRNHGHSMQMLKAVNSDPNNHNNNNNNNNNNNPNTINNNNFNTKDESYGKILVSPPDAQTDSDNNINHRHHMQHSTNKNHHYNTDTTSTHPSSSSPSFNYQQQHHMKPSTLDKLKHQLDLGLVETGAETGGSNNNENNDEMSKQNYGSIVGANPPVTGSLGAIASGFVDDSSADFEGFFHSSPLQQIEVRQMRAVNNNDDVNNERAYTFVRKTPPNTHDILLVD